MTAFNELNKPTNARDARSAIRQLQRVSQKAFQQNKLPDIVYGVANFNTPWGDEAIYRYTARQARELARLEREANRVRSIVGLEEIDYARGRSFQSAEGLNKYIRGLRNQGNLRAALNKRTQFVENYIQGLEAALGGDVDVFIQRVIDKIREIGTASAASIIQASIEQGINIHVFIFASDQTLISMNIAQIAAFWGVDMIE